MATLVGTIGTATQGTAGNNVTPSWGASENRTAGNLLICYVSITKSATLPTTPAGWYIASQVAGTSTSATIYYRAATGSDAAPTITGVTSGLIAAQLAEYSSTTSTIDRSATSTGTTSPNTATAGGTNAATGELIVMSSGDTRSVNRASNDTWTSNDGTVTAAGNNNGVSSQSHYSFGYILSSTATTAQTSVVTLSITTSITGIANVNASFRKGVGTFLTYSQANAYILNKFKVAQAQAKVINPSFVSSQAQSTIKGITQQFSQAQGSISIQIPFTDTFTRSVSNDLGVADNGDTWVLVAGLASEASVDGSKASFAITTTATDSPRYDLLNTIVDLNTHRGVEIYHEFSYSAVPSFLGQANVYLVDASGYNGGAGTDQVFTSIPSLNSSGNLTYTYGLYTATTGSTLGAYVLGTVYAYKTQFIRVSGNRIYARVKLWPVANPEPGWKDSFTFAATFTSPITHIRLNPGSQTTTNTLTYDNINITYADLTWSAQAQAKIVYKQSGFSQANARISPQYLSAADTFTRTTSNGFGTADTGGDWTVISDDAAFSTNGTQGIITPGNIVDDAFDMGEIRLDNADAFLSGRASTASIEFTYSTLPASNSLVSLGLATSTIGITGLTSIVPILGVGIRFTDGVGTYVLTYYAAFGSGSSGTIGTLVAGTTYKLTVQINTIYDPSNAANRANLRAKVDQVGSPEVGWQIQDNAIYSSAFSYMGRPGIYAALDTTPTLTIALDNYNYRNEAWSNSGQAQAKIFTPTKVSAQANARIAATVTTCYPDLLTTFTPLTYYRLGEPSGSFVDSANAETSGLSGTATRDVTGLLHSSQDDGALQLSGGGFIDVTHTAAASFPAGATARTIIGWIKTSSSATTPIFTYGNASTGNWIALYLNSNGQIEISNFDTEVTFGSVSQFNNNVGHMIAVTYNGTDWTAYADGVQVGSPQAQTLSTDLTGQNVWIGTNGSDFATAILDEVSLLSTALSSTNIYDLWTAGVNNCAAANTYQFSQAQAQIKQTYSQFSQAQTDIKATSVGVAQSQADIKAISWGFAQAQTSMVKFAKTNRSAQAQALLNTGFGRSQAMVVISGDYGLPFVDTFTRTVPTGLGVSDNGDTWILDSGSNATTSVDGTNVDIAATATNPAFSVSRTFANENGYEFRIYGIAFTTIPSSTTNRIIFGLADNTISNSILLGMAIGVTAAGNIDLSRVFSASLSTVASTAYTVNDVYNSIVQIVKTSKTLSGAFQVVYRYKLWKVGDTEPAFSAYTTSFTLVSLDQFISHPKVRIFSLSDTDVTFSEIAIEEALVVRNAQAQAKIKVIVPNFAQSQADIKATNYGFAQSQAGIKATNNGFAQSQTWVEVTASRFSQAQADIEAVISNFAQSQADIKAIGYGFAQAQTKIIPSRVFSQAQADIKTTYFGFAQAQTDIEAVISIFAQSQADIKATTSQFSQGQARIKQTYNGFAQAQGNIKQTYNSFAQVQATLAVTTWAFAQAQTKIIPTRNYAQSQADIKAVSWSWAQSNADIKQTYNQPAQAQTDVKAIGYGFGQAQADVKTTYTGFAQAQTDINQTYFGFAQAQTKIATTRAYGQSQADIKQTYFGWAQSQADIKAIGYGFAQSQADIESVVSNFSQAQADIKATYFGLAQAQSDIKQTYSGFAQAQTDVKAIGYGFSQAQTKIATTRAYAQSQADIKAIGYSWAQSNADIKQTYNQPAQAQVDVKALGYGFAQSQADIESVISNVAQAQADIKTAYFGFGQAQTKIATTRAYAQAQAQVKAFNVQAYAQAQVFLLGQITQYAQAQTDIKAKVSNFSQAQTDIKTTYTQYAQSQADILNTYFGFAQSQARIKQTYSQVSQAQADVKATIFVFAQSQADIKTKYSAFSQAQSDIKQTYSAFAQSQADIKQTYWSFAQAQAEIKQTYQGFAQSQTWIENTYVGVAQAQAAIKTTYFKHSQAQAKINAYNVQGYAQANAYILGAKQWYAQAQGTVKAVTYNWSQAQADVKTKYNSWAQAQASISSRYFQFSQAQAWIEATYSQPAQAQATIKATTYGFAQAQADIKQTYQVYAQAQARIKQTYLGYAQSQAYIKITVIQFAQAQATIKATTSSFAQALADILATSTKYASAQALIRTTVTRVAQAQALIQASTIRYAQAQAAIQNGGYAFGQAQAHIVLVDISKFAQAQVFILKSAGYAQANAYIFQPVFLHRLVISNAAGWNLVLSTSGTKPHPHLSNISKIGVALSTTKGLNITLSNILDDSIELSNRSGAHDET